MLDVLVLSRIPGRHSRHRPDGAYDRCRVRAQRRRSRLPGTLLRGEGRSFPIIVRSPFASIGLETPVLRSLALVRVGTRHFFFDFCGRH